ncbi:MAG: hypothetical protein HY904_01370 [Deltaproteobacteria bacterium]|nr:hypothetical protein [Deltaproteobacteria bacterium]
MTAVRPRRLAHRGRVQARARWFDRALAGDDAARRAVLAAWCAGATVTELAGGYLVRWPRVSAVDAELGAGVPLVEQADVLWGAPLAAAERADLEAAAGCVVLVRAGEAMALRPGAVVDVSGWVSLGRVHVADVAPLAAPAAPEPERPPPAVDLREKLGGIPPMAPSAVELAEQLRHRADGPRVVQLGTVDRLLLSVVRALRSLLPARTGKAHPVHVQALPPPAWLQRLGRWLDGVVARSSLGALVGRRYAAYLARLAEMFERGELGEALRHAIPLGGESAGGTGWSWGLPSPRADLSIAPWRGAASSSMALGPDVYDYMRRMYRAAFERLVGLGRLDEAAFILAELLGDAHEAVAFLEKHGRLKLAAELAEARGLPPGLVVRQLFIAGDVERAVDVARRSGAFADAVARLEKTDATQAAALRVLWASALADAGDTLRAVAVVWEVPTLRRLAKDWLQRAVEGGGEAGATALGRLLELDPALFDSVKLRVTALAADDDATAPAARVAALATLKETAAGRVLARALVRAAWQDVQEGRLVLANSVFRALVTATGDAALRADAPSLPAKKGEWLPARAEPRVFNCAASDSGSTPVHDVALLPDGRVAVALDALGVRVLSRRGRTALAVDEPATRWVLSDHGDRALAVRQLDRDRWRATRVDFRTGRAAPWLEEALTAFATTHDGAWWMVGRGHDLWALDLGADRARVAWRVPDVGGRGTGAVLDVARSNLSLAFLAGLESTVWRYEQPGMVLRDRLEVPLPEVALAARVTANAQLAVVRRASDDDATALVLQLRWLRGRMIERTVSAPGAGLVLLEANPQWVVTGVSVAAGVQVTLWDAAEVQPRAEFFLDGRKRACARLMGHALCLGDDRGTVLVLDLVSGVLVRDLRV